MITLMAPPEPLPNDVEVLKDASENIGLEYLSEGKRLEWASCKPKGELKGWMLLLSGDLKLVGQGGLEEDLTPEV